MNLLRLDLVSPSLFNRVVRTGSTSRGAGCVLVANSAFPPKNVTEFITAAQAVPGRYKIASAGNGTLNHLTGEMLSRAAGRGFEVLDALDTIEKLAAAGCGPFRGTTEQFAGMIKDDLPRWAKIVKDSGASVD